MTNLQAHPCRLLARTSVAAALTLSVTACGALAGTLDEPPSTSLGEPVDTASESSAPSGAQDAQAGDSESTEPAGDGQDAGTAPPAERPASPTGPSGQGGGSGDSGAGGGQQQPTNPGTEPPEPKPAPEPEPEPEPDPEPPPSKPAPADAPDPCGDGSEALAEDIAIREVALYQAVKIPLARDGYAVSDRNAPVVAGRDGLVRVFVQPKSGFQSRTLTGVLVLETGGRQVVYTSQLRPTGASSDSVANSTFNFLFDGEALDVNTRFSVALVDETCPRSFGSPRDARFPSSGTSELGAQAIGKLRVVVVPIQYEGGGRSITPDTSPPVVEELRQALLAYYPVPDVELSVRSPLRWTRSVTSSGQGWSQLLDAVMAARSRDGVPRDVYYFGMVAPADSFRSYCGWGCVLGLAPQTVYVSSRQQAGLGVGFAGEPETAETMVHELGHAHGRGHAPCGGAQGVDRSFPYSGGGTGGWGFDMRDRTLKDPSHKDVMGYCDPAWISDYTYTALAERSARVNLNALWSAPEEGPRWRSVLLLEDGSAQWGLSDGHGLPGGLASEATVYDARGEVLTTTTVVRLSLSHSEDEILYLPDPEPRWASVRLDDGRTVDLFRAAPAALLDLLPAPVTW